MGKYLCLVLAMACTGCMGKIHVPGQVAELHKGPFCSDVSTYSPPIWKAKTINKCATTFSKKCETKQKRQCGDVTQIRCEIHPYTECRMEMENTTYRGNEDKEETYVPWVCKEHDITVQHEKMIPVCKNITKQNCITIWKTDDNGNPVWAGKEDCQPVTWKECKLQPVLVDFVVPATNCSRSGSIPWKDCIEVNKNRMTTSMECDVFHTTSCEPETIRKCESIVYQECFEEAHEDCRPVEINYPDQEKEHKKKCLLAEDGGSVNGQLGAVPINSPRSHHDHHDHDRDHHDHNEEDSQVNRATRSGRYATHPSLYGFDLNKNINAKVPQPNKEVSQVNEATLSGAHSTEQRIYPAETTHLSLGGFGLNANIHGKINLGK